MIIIIRTIKFNEQPVVWDYDEKEDRAKCLFSLWQDNGLQPIEDKTKLIQHLRQYDKIEIDIDTASINKVKTAFSEFIQVKPRVPIRERPLPPLVFAAPMPSNSPKNFRRQRSSSLIDMKTYQKDQIIERARPKGMRFEDLLPETSGNATRIGNTIRYLTYFPNKSAAESKQKQKAFDSDATISSRLQYCNNDELHPVKKRQIELIKLFFDCILQPAMPEAEKDLQDYYAAKIETLMVNSPHNAGLTEYDRLNGRELFELFGPDFKAHLARCITYQYQGRTAYQLEPFYFFVNKEMGAELLTADPKLQKQLTLLKEAVRNPPELSVDRADYVRLLKLSVHYLQLLTMKSGRIVDKNRLIPEIVEKKKTEKQDILLEQLFVQYSDFDPIQIKTDEYDQLIKQLSALVKADEEESIPPVLTFQDNVIPWYFKDSYSLTRLLIYELNAHLPEVDKEYYRGKSSKTKKIDSKKERENYINSLGQEAVRRLIALLNPLTDERIPRKIDEDSDLYFSLDWADRLHKDLSIFITTSLEKRKEAAIPRRETILTALSEKIFNSICHKLDLVPKALMESSSPSPTKSKPFFFSAETWSSNNSQKPKRKQSLNSTTENLMKGSSTPTSGN